MNDESRNRINASAGRLNELSRQILGIDWYATESQARRVIEHFAEAESQVDAGIEAAPVQDERCDTCHGQGEIWTGETAYRGHFQPPEPVMNTCPECSGEPMSVVDEFAAENPKEWEWAALHTGIVEQMHDLRGKLVSLAGGSEALEHLDSALFSMENPKAEPAPAQEPLTGRRLYGMYTWPSDYQFDKWGDVKVQHADWNRLADRLNSMMRAEPAPAQDEQQPCAKIEVRRDAEGRLSAKVCAFEASLLPVGQMVAVYAAPIAQTAPQNFDDRAVDRFAIAMKAKMAAARAKGRNGWFDRIKCSEKRLAHMLVEHLSKGNEGTFEDVANFCMMLHQRGEDPQVLAEAAEAPIKKARGEALELGVRALESKTAPQPVKYTIGDLTYEKVFKAAGLTNLSDMQAVLDAVEVAVEVAVAQTEQTEQTEQQPQQSGLPEELFDGHAVYQETVRHRRDSGLLVRTSPENVSDTLDAVVRLIKSRTVANLPDLSHLQPGVPVPIGLVPGMREYIAKGLADGTLTIGGAISATGERVE